MQFPNFKKLSLQTSFPWTVNGEGHGGQESPQSTFVRVGWVAGKNGSRGNSASQTIRCV